MRGKCIVSLLAVVLMLSAVKSVHASINIHEILADPPTGLSGDANGDGVRSSKDDEFVELFNRSSSTMDISNWCLTDLTSIRHVFGRDSLIEPLSVIVVFAGGSPSFTTFHWQIAATNNLGLNNDGDTVSLFDADGALVDQVVYGPEAGNDQSIVRAIEGTDSEWIRHEEIENSQGKSFSPGYLINEQKIELPADPAVPEPATIVALLSGLSSIYIIKRW